MVNGDQRRCDICAEPIPRGSMYRRGYTMPDAVARCCEDDPQFAPSFTQKPDGTVRFDVCEECAALSEGLGAVTQPVTDPLH